MSRGENKDTPLFKQEPIMQSELSMGVLDQELLPCHWASRLQQEITKYSVQGQ